MGFSFKEMALEFLEGYCFEKHLKKNAGGGGGVAIRTIFIFLENTFFRNLFISSFLLYGNLDYS